MSHRYPRMQWPDFYVNDSVVNEDNIKYESSFIFFSNHVDPYSMEKNLRFLVRKRLEKGSKPRKEKSDQFVMFNVIT